MGSDFLRYQPMRNIILSGLPDNEIQTLRPYLRRVRLVPGQVLMEQGQIAEHVFFIEDGIVSLVLDPDVSRSHVQVAMIGREGLVGAQAILGADISNFTCAITQIPGPALRLSVSDLRSLLEDCPELRRLCMADLDALMRQTMQTAACNARGTLVGRCVRWLLMAHDRIEGDELPITHEALAGMLGVRRSGITLVASGLMDAGLISVRRGRITIQDRRGLERAAGSLSWSVATEPADSNLSDYPVREMDHVADASLVRSHIPANDRASIPREEA
jgi:CRP-like cAMP-binding protein